MRAAILRPQLKTLDDSGRRWNERFDAFSSQLKTNANAISLPQRHPKAYEIPSSIQFQIPSFSDEQNLRFLDTCAQRGVDIKWFGADEPKAYTSRYDSWQYLEATALPNTDLLLKRLYDCRLPLTFSVGDCATIGSIIADITNSMLDG